jgi:two-component system phosphate regulon sensor histidine kinase PhoR
MNRRALTFVILLASLALLGLMSIQVAWIRNSMEIREENFRRGVSDAARHVIRRLEQIDAFQMMDKDGSTQGEVPELAELDSLRRSFDKYLRSNRSLLNKPRERQRNRAGTQEMRRETRPTAIVPGMKPADPLDIQRPSDDIPDSLKQAVVHAFVQRKAELMEKALGEMLFRSQPFILEHNIRQGMLDTLLRTELHNRGILADYAFGVFNPLRNGFTILSDESLEKELLTEGMLFTLYPSDMLSNPDYLILHFPRQRSYLLTQMWALVVISFVLMLVIILSFAYSINSLLRQRRFAEMKNDFINNMTHEFKTPISTVALACEALNDKDIKKSEDLYGSYISIISEENRRLGIMAEKILQTAIIEKGELSLKKELIDLHEVITDVVRNIRIQIEIKDGNIGLQLSSTRYLIQADPVHMANVIYNLLDNANKYTPRKPNITVSTEDYGTGLMVRVKDNGIGISKSDQRKIFDRLYRVPTGNVHNFKGFGLGLSYVKAIVEKHGGRTGVESEPGKGSEFWFTLPG